MTGGSYSLCLSLHRLPCHGCPSPSLIEKCCAVMTFLYNYMTSSVECNSQLVSDVATCDVATPIYYYSSLH